MGRPVTAAPKHPVQVRRPAKQVCNQPRPTSLPHTINHLLQVSTATPPHITHPRRTLADMPSSASLEA